MDVFKAYLKKAVRKLKGARRSYQDPARNEHCSSFEVDNWEISDFVMRRLVPKVGIRPFPVTELFLMTATVCRIKPTHIFEWGTNIGKSARAFYEISRAFGIACEIHSIDLPDDVDHQEHPERKRGMLVRGIKQVTLHQGDGLQSALRLYSEALPRYKQVRPLFFIDGDHSYESVKRELTEILRSVPEAAVLLHDTFCQSSESGYNIGPYLAINEVLETMPSQYSSLSMATGLPGMTLLYQPLQHQAQVDSTQMLAHS